MSPIRVGIIGLSASAQSGTRWASYAHLPYLLASPHYTIVAVCNSSLASAHTAIETFKLDPSATKAYGSPADIAADPDVELIVCATRVDKHYDCILPSLKAGKDVYCEWPLAQNVHKAEELLEVARESGSRTMVGLQGRLAPLVQKVRELVREGRLGDVLSSTYVASAGSGGAEEPLSTKYIVDREVGGNMLTVHTGHSLDLALHALNGELSEYSSVLATQRPTVDIIDAATNEIVERKVSKNTADQVLVQGYVDAEGASSRKPLLSYHMRGGKPHPGAPALTWTIYGTKAELSITAATAALVHVNTDVKVQLHDAKTDMVEEVDLGARNPFEGEGGYGGIVEPGYNVARLYEQFRKGEGYPTFEDAVRRHRLLDGMTARWDAGTQFAASA